MRRSHLPDELANEHRPRDFQESRPPAAPMATSLMDWWDRCHLASPRCLRNHRYVLAEVCQEAASPCLLFWSFFGFGSKGRHKHGTWRRHMVPSCRILWTNLAWTSQCGTCSTWYVRQYLHRSFQRWPCTNDRAHIHLIPHCLFFEGVVLIFGGSDPLCFVRSFLLCIVRSSSWEANLICKFSVVYLMTSHSAILSW